MQCLPHPLNFAWWGLIDNDELGMSDMTAVLNSQLSGNTLTEKNTSWMKKAERWRLAYAGVTFHFDGPALANQGTLVCAQVPYAPRKRFFSAKNAAGETCAMQAIRFADGTTSDSLGWQRGPDFPSFASTQSMPNCYLGEVKDGLYVPMKLTKTCQEWHSLADVEAWSVDHAPTADASSLYGILPKASTSMQYPFPGYPLAAVSSDSTALFSLGIPPLGNDVVANVCGRNISANSALIVEFRYGFEVQCEPGTELSPFLRVSPPYDSAALKEYFAIARELKDAYPADYNDLGKLWDVIKQAARVVGPSLGMIPKVGPFLSMAAQAIGGSGPAAAVEREQQFIANGERNAWGNPVSRASTRGRSQVKRKSKAKAVKQVRVTRRR